MIWFARFIVFLSFTTFLVRPQFWFQEIVASYWWALFLCTPFALLVYLRRAKEKRFAYISVLILMVCVAKEVGTFFLVNGIFSARKDLSPKSLIVQFVTQTHPISKISTLYALHDCLNEIEFKEAAQFSHRYHEGCFFLLSKFPLTNFKRHAFGDDVSDILSFNLQYETKNVTFYVTDVPLALSQDQWSNNRIALRRLATELRHREEVIVVLGNFSSGTFGRSYESFESASRLIDVRLGEGIVGYFIGAKPPFGSPTIHGFMRGFQKGTIISQNQDELMFSLYDPGF